MRSSSSNKNSMGGGSRGGGGGFSTSSRDSPRHGSSTSSTNGGTNGTAPRGNSGGTGAWGSGRPSFAAPPKQQQQQQQHGHGHGHGHGSNSSSSTGSQQQQRSSSTAAAAVGDGYKLACRDRWMNVTKTMMGEHAEITTTSGCVYEGVFHVLNPAGDDPRPGGRRGMYRVRLAFDLVFVAFSFLAVPSLCLVCF